MATMGTRDFIPAGAPKTPKEVERSKQLKAMGAGRVRLDFIPGPDHKMAPPSGRKEQAREALERALARQASAAREDYDTAIKTLAGLNVAQAIEHITQAPFSVQELLLVVEATHGKRSSILNRFPPVDPKAVLRWEEINSGAPDKASEAAPSGPAEDAGE